jgi:hypothetical protein
MPQRSNFKTWNSCLHGSYILPVRLTQKIDPGVGDTQHVR